MDRNAVAIIDYKAGNLRSVANAVASLGYPPMITSRSQDILGARAVILPGVGAALSTMSNINTLGLAGAIREIVAADRPFFGICMGLQVLFDATEEDSGQACLGIFSGRVRRLGEGLKIPHTGWNQVKQTAVHSIFDGIPDGANFYFVHSYYAVPEDRSLVAGETEYGATMCSVIARGNLVATQFHPEKSGEVGLRMFDNFIKMAFKGGGR